MAYKYTDYGSAHPAAAKYYDNSGYYVNQNSRALSDSFEPVRMYPAEGMRVVSAGGKPSYNWHILRAAVTSLFCYPLFGMIGITYAIISYVDFENGKYRKYRGRNSCAAGWSIAGIICGVLGWLSLIVYMALLFVYRSNIASYYKLI